MSSASILGLDGVSKRYGGIQALHDISLSLEAGEFVGLIGPNGAGKTTLINVIMGLTMPDEGAVSIQGQDALGTSPHERFDLGVAKTFQETGLFMNLTVRECVLVGLKRDETSFTSAFNTPSEDEIGQCDDVLRQVGLYEVRDQGASQLSYGQKRLLDLAMALASDPALLLLDEPVAGLNPDATRKFEEIIADVHDEDRTFVLIEHNTDVVMRLCERVIVLNEGEIQLVGPPGEVENDPQVIEAFFGGETVA
jgi:branched-chain amino acid transport system ATP-binding protein